MQHENLYSEAVLPTAEHCCLRPYPPAYCKDWWASVDESSRVFSFDVVAGFRVCEFHGGAGGICADLDSDSSTTA
jgi:hypothetical protein